MEISSETIKRYGEEPGWYEGRLSKDPGRITLSQGHKYAYLDEDSNILEEHLDEIIFVKGTLRINPKQKIFVLTDVEQFGKLLGKHKQNKYLGKSGDVVIHSEKYSCDETRQTGLLKDVNIKKIEGLPIW